MVLVSGMGSSASSTIWKARYSLNCFVSFSIFALRFASIVSLMVTLLAFRIVSGSLQVIFLSSCKYFWQKFETTFGQPLVSFETFLRQQSWGKMSWGKISLGQNVSGAKCPWGKMSLGQMSPSRVRSVASKLRPQQADKFVCRWTRKSVKNWIFYSLGLNSERDVVMGPMGEM